MKICLIRCPSPFLIEDKAFPPLGLMAVGTVLKLKGHEVTIADGEVPLGFEYYGFGPTIPEYSWARNAKNEIKQRNPKAKVAIGGPFATLNPLKCYLHGWDSIVVKDGEPVVEQAFLNGGRIFDGSEPSLDSHPIPDRTLLNIRDYSYFLEGKCATTIMTSQGCPWKCGFCCKTYEQVRFRSVPRVIEEIDMLYYELGYQALAFPEDIFILKKKRVEKIAQHLKRLGIIWRCLVRADVLVSHGTQFAEMMADSGCVSVGIGVESGSDKILSIVNKGESIATIKQAVRMLKRAGIKVKGYFIVGLPGESQQTIDETRRFLDEANLDDMDIKIYQPYPNTPIWENRKKYDIQWNDDLDYAEQFYKGRPREYYGNVCTSQLTNEQIKENWIQMEAEYKK